MTPLPKKKFVLNQIYSIKKKKFETQALVSIIKKRNASVSFGVTRFQINERGRRLYFYGTHCSTLGEEPGWSCAVAGAHGIFPQGQCAWEHGHRKALPFLTSFFLWKALSVLQSYSPPSSALLLLQCEMAQGQNTLTRSKKMQAAYMVSRIVLPHQSGPQSNKFQELKSFPPHAMGKPVHQLSIKNNCISTIFKKQTPRHPLVQ